MYGKAPSFRDFSLDVRKGSGTWIGHGPLGGFRLGVVELANRS